MNVNRIDSFNGKVFVVCTVMIFYNNVSLFPLKGTAFNLAFMDV